MPTYLGMRIIAGAMDYTVVINLYPQFKDGVDTYLDSKGYEHVV